MRSRATMLGAGLVLCAAIGATAQPRVATDPAPALTTPQLPGAAPRLLQQVPSPSAQPLPGAVQSLPTPGILVSPGSDDMRTRMRAYIAARGAQLLARAALTQAGLSAENDAVEQGVRLAGVWMAPLHVGLAGTATPPSLNVDPAALEGARAAARRRVGHDPTEAEVAQDLAAFDQAIARINQGLAERQAEIAVAYKQTGRFPRALEAPLLGVRPPATALASPTAAERAALQRVLTVLFNATTPAAPAPPR